MTHTLSWYKEPESYSKELYNITKGQEFVTIRLGSKWFVNSMPGSIVDIKVGDKILYKAKVIKIVLTSLANVNQKDLNINIGTKNLNDIQQDISSIYKDRVDLASVVTVLKLKKI